ncbi:hemagglutinin repeat-containing protein [Palleronia caenipelagi]|uniref:hemagglutinin repeat-containing protein n=1 Tax=Palleronia caenipelagi TaxID=2489174 RepID=UPI001C8F45AF|nr:hemagglutinin repeat-containing protein [Palleronia caenipelagi]
MGAGDRLAILASEIAVEGLAYGLGSAVLSASEGLTSSGLLESGGALELSAVDLLQLAGGVTAAGALDLDAVRLEVLAGAELLSGSLSARADDLALDGLMAVQNTADVVSTDVLRLSGTLYSGGDLSLSGERIESAASAVAVAGVDFSDLTASLGVANLTLSAASADLGGEMLTGGTATVQVDGALSLRGLLSSDQSLQVNASSIDQTGQVSGKNVSVTAQGNYLLDGDTFGQSHVSVSAGGRTDIAGTVATFQTDGAGNFILDGTVEIQANDILVSGGLAGGRLVLQSITDIANSGDVLALGNVDWIAGRLIRNDGVIDASDVARIEARTVENHVGAVLSAERIRLVASDTLSNSGDIGAATELNIASAQLENSGQLRAGLISISTDELRNNAGGVFDSISAQLNADTHLINEGKIVGTDWVLMSAGELRNAGLFHAGSGLEVVSDSLVNSEAGIIQSQGTVAALVDGSIANNGLIRSLGDIVLDSEAGNITNRGLINGERVFISTPQQIVGDAGSIIGQSLVSLDAARLGRTDLSGANTLQSLGMVASGGGLSLTLSNAGLIVSSGASLAVLGDLRIDLSGSIRNNGIIRAGGSLMLTSAADIINHQSLLKSGETMSLTASNGAFENLSGIVEAGGDLTISASSVVNSYLTVDVSCVIGVCNLMEENYSEKTIDGLDHIRLRNNFARDPNAFDGVIIPEGPFFVEGNRKPSSEYVYKPDFKYFFVGGMGDQPIWTDSKIWSYYLHFDDPLNFLHPLFHIYGGDNDDGRRTDYRFFWEEGANVSLSGAQPIIRSDSTIKIISDQITNDLGLISADKDVVLRAGTVRNTGYDTTKYRYEKEMRYYRVGNDDYSTSYAWMDGRQTELLSVVPGKKYLGRIVAGRNLSINGTTPNGSGGVVNTGVIEGSSTQIVSDQITGGLASGNFIVSDNTVGSVGIDLSDYAATAVLTQTAGSPLSPGTVPVATGSAIDPSAGMRDGVADASFGGVDPATGRRIDTRQSLKSTIARQSANSPNVATVAQEGIDPSQPSTTSLSDQALLFRANDLLGLTSADALPGGFATRDTAGLLSTPDYRTSEGDLVPSSDLSRHALLRSVGFKGDIQFLVDPATEAETIRLANLQQTGRAFLYDEWRTAEDQHDALLENALAFFQTHPGVELGKALSAEQIGNLKAPLLWYVEKTVDGQRVLVPTLYLSQNERNNSPPGSFIGRDNLVLEGGRIALNDSSLLSGRNVTIQSDTTASFGRISATDRLDLRALGATSDLVFSDLELDASPRSLSLYAGRDLLINQDINVSGKLELVAGRDLTLDAIDLTARTALLQAGRDIQLLSQITRTEDIQIPTRQVEERVCRIPGGDGCRVYGTVTKTIPAEGSIRRYSETVDVPSINVRGDLSLFAGRDILQEGGTVSGGDIVLSASRDISIKPVELRSGTEAYVDRSDPGCGWTCAFSSERYRLTSESSSLARAQIDASGSLTLTAGRDLTITSANLDAGGDVSLRALRDIKLNTADQTTQGSFASVFSQRDWNNSTAITSNISSANGNISILADRNLRSHGAGIFADGALSLAAGSGALDFLAARSSTYEKERRSSRKTTSTMSSQVSRLESGENLTLLAGTDLTAEGLQVSVVGGVEAIAGSSLTLAAAANEETYQKEKISRGFLSKKKTTISRYDLTYQGTSISAGEGLRLASGDTMTLAGSQLASTGGHVALDVGDDLVVGIYEDESSYSKDVSKSSFGGLIRRDRQSSSSRTTAGTSDLTAGADLSLASEGNTRLIGSQLVAGGRATITTGGNLNVEGAISTLKTSYFEDDSGAVLKTVTTENTFDQTVEMARFDGDFTFDIGGTTTLTRYDDVYSGDWDARPGTTVDGVSLPGVGTRNPYPDALISGDNVTIVTEELLHSYEFEQNRELSPAFKALVTTAAMLLVGQPQFLVQTFGTSTATGLTTFGIQAGIGTLEGALTGEFDLGDILGDAALSGVTAGIGSGLTTAINLETLGVTLPDSDILTTSLFGDGNLTIRNVAEATLDSGLTAGVGTVVTGSDFGDAFTAGLTGTIVNLAMADAQNEIGGLVVDGTLAGEGSLGHLILHAAVGCGAAELQGGDCAAGAAAGATQSLYAGTAPVTGPESNPTVIRNASLLGAAVGYAFSGGEADNVGIASQVTASGIENNYLTHDDVNLLRQEYDACLAKAQGCSSEEIQALYDKYQDISDLRNEALLAECRDALCVSYYKDQAVSVDDFLRIMDGTAIGNVTFSNAYASSEIWAQADANVLAYNGVIGSHCKTGDVTCLDEARGHAIVLVAGLTPGAVGTAVGLSECVQNPSAIGCSLEILSASAGALSRVVGNVIPTRIAPNRVDDVPQITRNRQHHEQKVNEVVDDLEAQGYQVDTEVSFRGCDTTRRCRADVVARDENGRVVQVVEVKTGDAGLSPNQAEIYPQVANGDAIPTGQVAERLGLRPGVPLRDQGYPNGIPVEVRTFEGVNQ